MMKRLTAYILIMALILTLAACGSAVPAPSGSTDQPQLSLPPVRPLDELGTEAQDIPVRIQTFEADADGDGVIAEVLVLYLSLPNAGEYSIDAYVGNTHVHTEPFDISTPQSVLSDSSGGVIGECVLGNRDPWGVEVWASVAGHAWDLEAIPTITLECESDTGSTISGEYSVEEILVEGSRWYRDLENGYQESAGISATPLRGLEHGDFVCLTFESVLPDEARLGQGGLANNEFVESSEDSLLLVFKGDLTNDPWLEQSFNIEDLSVTLDGVTKPLYISTRSQPIYHQKADVTVFQVYPNLWIWGDEDALEGSVEAGESITLLQTGEFSAEMICNTVHVTSNTFVVDELGRIAVKSEAPVSKLNSHDLSYYGNSHGNAAFRGLAAEKDGWIYYTNGGDGGSLYKMRPSGAEKTKLNDEPSDSINVVDGWVYYRNYEEGYLYRVRTDGTDRTLLCSDKTADALVVAGWIYYANTGDNRALYRVRTDGTDRMPLDSASTNSSCINVVGDTIIALDMQDPIDKIVGFTTHNIAGVSSFDFSPISGIYLSYIIDGDYAYGGHADMGGAILKHDYTGSRYMVLNEEPSAFVNPSGEWVYYSNLAEDGYLYKVRTDGTQRTKLNEDSSENINVVRDWIYYENMSDNGRIYRMRTDGTERQPVE